MPTITHTDDLHYVLNMHSMHNPHLVRHSLPRSLVQPVRLYATPEERQQHHANIAAILQVKGPKKRAEALQKAAQTRQRKAAEAATAREDANAIRGAETAPEDAEAAYEDTEAALGEDAP
jgi:hypothetical protein